MELIELSPIADYVPGSKIKELNLFDFIPELTTPLRDPKTDLWEDTDVDFHYAGSFGLGDTQMTLVGDNNGESENDTGHDHDDDDNNGLDMNFILCISGKRVACSELLGKEDPKEVGTKGIKKRNPIKVRRHKRKLEKADAAFGNFVVQNVEQRKDNKIKVAIVQEKLKFLVTHPSMKAAFLEDARQCVKATLTK
jgi:hypothetical protein